MTIQTDAPTLTKRRQVRLLQAHDDALSEIARRRGCDVVDLFREAIIAHFNLPTDVRQTHAMIGDQHSD